MTTTETANETGQGDSELVSASRTGSREAFRQIVERYQGLICSLAYSATGSVAVSEDVAQETFISAWKDLDALREPGSLRSWLCGIARNQIRRRARSEGREPLGNAVDLDEASEVPAPEALPSDQAVTREEEALLWRSLGRIPALYREPLILFYRQHKSVSAVAADLELSEDTVKQRLVRGRRLLEEEVHSFLESALLRTAPGDSFTCAVFAALPIAAGSAATGSAAAKGAALLKSGLLVSWIGPMAGLLAGFSSQWWVIRAATPVRDRPAKLARLVATWACLLAIPIAGEASVRWLGRELGWDDRGRFASVAVFWGFYAIILATWLILKFRSESAARMALDDATPDSRAVAVPMTRAQTALLVCGLYLTILSWLMFMAWRLHDLATLVSIVALMPVLSVWSFFRLRSSTGVASIRAAYGFAAWCCVVAVAAVNFRLASWVAASRGISVLEARRLLPLGVVPLLTLALLAWCLLLLAASKPKTRH
jgi:RNA polymerase sigma factor (sigma-70 family)